MLDYTKEKAKKIIQEPVVHFTLFTFFFLITLSLIASEIALPIFIICGLVLFIGTMIIGRRERRDTK